MASGSSSEGQQTSAPTSPIYSSPLGPVFANMFGVPVSFNRQRGGFQIAGQPGTRATGTAGNALPGALGGRDFAPQIITPNMLGSLSDQLQPTGPNPFSSSALEGLDQALNLYDETLLPGAQELASTGFRTDAGPIAQQQFRQFEQEVIPGLAEQFSFLGGGGQTLSSDFGAAAARSGEDLLTNIGALQTQLDESAAGRRTEGLQLGAMLGSERAKLPLDVGMGIAESDATFRASELAGRPGGQLLSFLDSLMGLERDPIVQANVSQGTSKTSSGGVF